MTTTGRGGAGSSSPAGPSGRNSPAIRLLIDAVAPLSLLAALAVVWTIDGPASRPPDVVEGVGPGLPDAEAVPPPPPAFEPPPPDLEVPEIPELPPIEALPEPDPVPPPMPQVEALLGELRSPVDPTPRIVVRYCDYGRFGVSTTTGNPDDPSDDGKQLTYSTNGSTNNTRVSIDGATPLFGEVGAGGGRIVRPMQEVPPGRYEMEWECRDIYVVQIVQHVAGETSRRIDAIQVDYQLENRGEVSRAVGLRVMLDSLIGGNDGVPFIVPGREQLVTSPQEYRGEEVPHFVRALEVGNLVRPGVIADLGLRPAEGERPDEVILTHWPGSVAPWDYNRTASFGQDTAIGLYYDPRSLAAGEQRQIRFTYGLGTISSTQSRNASLGLTAGAPFNSGGRFWLVALVQNPTAGQEVRVELPAGLTFAEGHPAAKPVTIGKDYTQLSWLIQVAADRLGEAVIEAELQPGGVREQFELTIQPSPARLRVVSQGPFYAGTPFWVLAVVQHPKAGQSVAVELPPGIRLVGEGAAEKPVPHEEEHSRVGWLVEASQESLGAATISVGLQPDDVTERCEVSILPPQTRLTLFPPEEIRAARPFWLVALVQHGKPEQAVELALPEGFTLVRGEPRQAVAPNADSGMQINWLIKPPGSPLEGADIAVHLQPDALQQRCPISVLPPVPRLSLLPQGPFRSGGLFWVAALVQDAGPDHTVELDLPAGLALEKGTAGETLRPREDGLAQVNWLIRVSAETLGSFELTARLKPDGIEQRATIEVQTGSLIE